MKILFRIQHLNDWNVMKVPLFGMIVLGLLFSCTKDADPELSAVSQQNTELAAKGNLEITVKAGGSIQEAVDKASPGAVIKIMEGTYKESIIVNKCDIKIVGEGCVTIVNPGDEENGFTVRSTDRSVITGFTLENVTIKGFKENGVFLIRVDGFLLKKIITIDNGEYGLFPVLSKNGKIEYCTASGHTDTGIYVGQSTNVEISHCTAFENVLGIELENSSKIIVRKNNCYNNVTGILAILLPQLTVKVSSDILISQNTLTGNNHVNFAEPGEGFESAVPSGIGILIVGTDKTIAEKNIVKNNNFLGIGVFSSLAIGSIAGIPAEAFADIEPNPDNAKIISNNLVNNGTVQPPLPLPAVDLLWDGTGLGNCWSNNTFTTSFPSPLPACL